MKLLLLLGLSVLLSYGVVEAKIEVGDGPDGNVTAEEIWADQKNRHRQYCEEKMKAAMRAMDKIMRGDWVHTPYNTYEYQSMVPNAQERELWERVMKECVRP